MLKLRADLVTALFLECRAASQNHDYAAASTAIDKVIQQRPDWAAAYFFRGLIFSRLNQPDHAVENYKKAVDLDPNFGSAYSELAAAQMQLGQLDEAARNLDKALELEPNLISVRESRAKLLGTQGNLPAEERELAVILALAPADAWAKNTLEAVHQKLQSQK